MQLEVPGPVPRTSSAPAPDFLLSNHGSIVLLEPQSDSAVAWIDDNLDQDHMLFGAAVVIEPRYVSEIVAGIQRDGLVLR